MIIFSLESYFFLQYEISIYLLRDIIIVVVSSNNDNDNDDDDFP